MLSKTGSAGVGNEFPPCDVINGHGQPYTPERASMNFNVEHAGFYRTFSHGARKAARRGAARAYHFSMQNKALFQEAVNKSVRFTYVTDPITKFVGGYAQVNKYTGYET